MRVLTRGGAGAVFLDAGLPGLDLLLSGVDGAALCRLVHAREDGLDVILATLEGAGTVSEVVVVAHGGPGAVRLGRGTLDLADLAVRPDSWRTLGRRVAPGGSLSLVACAAGNGARGWGFLRALAALTGRTVRASSDSLGSGRAVLNLEMPPPVRYPSS